MSTGETKAEMATPREYDYWEPAYRELALLPEWAALDEEGRARRLLERIERALHEADTPPQLKALFSCAPEGRLQTAREMIAHFSRKG